MFSVINIEQSSLLYKPLSVLTMTAATIHFLHLLIDISHTLHTAISFLSA